jgi:transcriptional regulator with XRE-family HTH domain
VVGRNFQELRLRLGWTQEDAARALREAGMPWSRDQVAFLESGRREDIQLSDLILLSAVFEVPLRRWFQGQGFVQLAELKLGALDDIRLAMGSDPLSAGAIWSPAPPNEGAPDAADPDRPIRLYRPIPSQAERNAARKLGVDPLELHELAMRLWQRGLDEERDRRLAERGVFGGSRGAYRGHVTRTLVEDLRQMVHRPQQASRPGAPRPGRRIQRP